MTLTATGFERPRLPELKTKYDASFTEALGAVNTSPDAVVGQIIGIFSAAVDDAYEALQDTYDAMYPASAEGLSLDGSVSYVGLQRLAAAPTTVTAVCYGSDGTLVTAGSLARSIDGKQYACLSDSVISRSNIVDAKIEIQTVLNSTIYQVVIGGVSSTYTSDASATAQEIANGLALALNSSLILATASNGVLNIRSVDKVSGRPLSVDGKMTVTLIGTPVAFSAIELGAHGLPAGALNTIDSSVVGWDAINNLAMGSTGRDVESDEALRLRHANGIRATGSATAQAIKARLLAEVDSVSLVQIYENRTPILDQFLLPPHSFEAVVVGGEDNLLASKLFRYKPAGIETYGNTSIQVTDENGDSQTCRFSRAVTRYAWVRVTVNLTNPEETLSATASDSIKAAVLAYGNSIGIGNDLITQRFFGSIYASTPGLGQITVEAAITPGALDTPVYSTANISVARAELSLFDLARITVVGL